MLYALVVAEAHHAQPKNNVMSDTPAIIHSGLVACYKVWEDIKIEVNEE